MSWLQRVIERIAPPTILPPAEEPDARREATEALRQAAAEARRLRFKTYEPIPRPASIPDLEDP